MFGTNQLKPWNTKKIILKQGEEKNSNQLKLDENKAYK